MHPSSASLVARRALAIRLESHIMLTQNLLSSHPHVSTLSFNYAVWSSTSSVREFARSYHTACSFVVKGIPTEGGRCGFESELLLPSEWKDKAGLNCGFCSSDNALQKEQLYPNTVFTPPDQKCLSQACWFLGSVQGWRLAGSEHVLEACRFWAFSDVHWRGAAVFKERSRAASAACQCIGCLCPSAGQFGETSRQIGSSRHRGMSAGASPLSGG